MKTTDMIADSLDMLINSGAPPEETADDVYDILTEMYNGRARYLGKNSAYVVAVLNWIINNADVIRMKKWMNVLCASLYINTISIPDPTPARVATFAMLFPGNKTVAAIMAKDYKGIADMIEKYRWGHVAIAIAFALTIRDVKYLRICNEAGMSGRIVDYSADRITKDRSLVDEKMIMDCVTDDMIIRAEWDEWSDSCHTFILNVIRYGSDSLIRRYIIDAYSSLRYVIDKVISKRNDMNMGRYIHYLYSRGFRISSNDKYYIDRRFMDMIVMSNAECHNVTVKAHGRIRYTPSKNVRKAVAACKANDNGCVFLSDVQREYKRIIAGIASKMPGDVSVVCYDE